MKLSYQAHYDSGKREKTWFISREQSYHGSSTDALAVGHRPNLDFYKPLLPKERAKIPEHNVYRTKNGDETLEKESTHEHVDKNMVMVNEVDRNGNGIIYQCKFCPDQLSYWVPQTPY